MKATYSISNASALYLPKFDAQLLSRYDSLVITGGKFANVSQHELDDKLFQPPKNFMYHKGDQYGTEHCINIPAELYSGDPLVNTKDLEVLTIIIRKEIDRLFAECSQHFKECLEIDACLLGWNGTRIKYEGVEDEETHEPQENVNRSIDERNLLEAFDRFGM